MDVFPPLRALPFNATTFVAVAFMVNFLLIRPRASCPMTEILSPLFCSLRTASALHGLTSAQSSAVSMHEVLLIVNP